MSVMFLRTAVELIMSGNHGISHDISYLSSSLQHVLGSESQRILKMDGSFRATRSNTFWASPSCPYALRNRKSSHKKRMKAFSSLKITKVVKLESDLKHNRCQPRHDSRFLNNSIVANGADRILQTSKRISNIEKDLGNLSQDFFICELCDITLKCSTDLRDHVKIIHNTDFWFQCVTCNYGTPIIWNFQEHLAAHWPADGSSSNLGTSELINIGGLLYECTYCSEVCQSLEEAWAHHKEHAVSISKNNCNNSRQ